jgi:hypothetical protein
VLTVPLCHSAYGARVPQAGDIFRMVIGEGLTLSLIGLALGLVGACWLGRAGSSLLFGVTATDPLTFMTVSLHLYLLPLPPLCGRSVARASTGYFPAHAIPRSSIGCTWGCAKLT